MQRLFKWPKQWMAEYIPLGRFAKLCPNNCGMHASRLPFGLTTFHSSVPLCLSVFRSVCLYICLSLYRYVFIFVCLYICLSLCISSVFISVCLYICLPFYLSAFISVYLYICLSLHLPVFISVCLYNCMFLYLSVFISVFFYICLSLCLSVYYIMPCLLSFRFLFDFTSLYLVAVRTASHFVCRFVSLTVCLFVCGRVCLPPFSLDPCAYMCVCLCVYLFVCHTQSIVPFPPFPLASRCYWLSHYVTVCYYLIPFFGSVCLTTCPRLISRNAFGLVMNVRLVFVSDHLCSYIYLIVSLCSLS